MDKRFRLVSSFNIVVPKNYDHATCLSTFRREHEREFYYYDPAITDQNFIRATTKLAPGRRLRVRDFEITRGTRSEDCLGFLKSQNGILVGAQGASLAYEQGKEHLPKGWWHASFDEKDALWKYPDGYPGVPCIKSLSWDCSFGFMPISFLYIWSVYDYLLCFSDDRL